MGKYFKCTLSILLTVIMLLGAAPLGPINLASKANAMDLSSYSVGDSTDTGIVPAFKFNPSSLPEEAWSISIRCTNNIATSQTVTFDVSSTGTVAGYYWGTNSDYSKNSYYTVSKPANEATVNITVSSSGKYYFTAKSTSGSFSQTEDITFYRTDFNAAGGSVSPAYIISRNGYQITLPTPTKSGSTFIEWNTSADGTGLPFKSDFINNRKDTTLYAIWDYETITPGSITEVSIENGGQTHRYQYTPYNNETYVLYSKGTEDTKAMLYDSSWVEIASDDNSGENSNFRLEYSLKGGETYYYGIKYSDNSKTGKINTYFGPVYTITYDANGGTGAPGCQKLDWNRSITLSSSKPTRAGYSFLGWSLFDNASTAEYQPGDKFSLGGYLTLYAVWRDITDPTGSISSTNNVAASQTVTLSLSDNAGVAGYYWGTSSTYSNNTYTATSSSSVTKSISSAGTYYLTVKDTSGNVSSNYSITFYKTTLNANGGSVYPPSVLTKSGKSFTLPTPTYYGNAYKNWNTSSDGTGTSYTGNYTVNGSKTLYAQYTTIDTTKPTGSISSTNNVASSQTVTLSLSDNVGVSGYYWGTNSTYSNNTYTAASSASVTKSISSAGTYYLTVKDTSGNVSSNYSITFYKTTLNANGGSVSPTAVLTQSGKSFTFPTPVKSGYTYSGWSTSSSAASGVSTLKPASNTTYYAVWKSASQEFNQSNRFSFSNSSSNFVTSWSGGSYYMTQSDYDKLISYIKKYDSNPSSTISNVQKLMNSSWSGSCYGMASAAVLDYQNKIAFNENFGNGAKTMWDVKSPSTDKNIMSAINYYMVSQKIGFVRNSSSYYDKDYYPSSWTPGLKKLVSTAQKGEPFLFCYYWTEGYSSYGHAIVALDCKINSDGSFSITAYDNRYPNKDVIIKVNSNYTSCVVNGDENAEAFEIYNDMSAFNKIDIDGPKNDMNITSDSYSYSNVSDEISVVANGDVTVTNADGETISIINGDIGGTMDILSVHMIVRDTADGEAGPVEFVFEVGHSKTYMFESTDDEMEVSVKTKDIFGSATSEKADCIAIGDDGVYVIGNDMEYSTALSSKDNGYDTVIVEGSAKRDVSLTYSGNSILISGVTGKDETITIYTHDETEPEEYAVKEGYEQVKVTADDNDIDIKASSKNDGNYDISVKEAKNTTANAVINIAKAKENVNYRSIVTIKATAADVPDAYHLALYVNGVKVSDGSNTEVSYTYGEIKGDLNYTVKVVDSKGNVQKDADGNDLSEDGKITVNAGFFKKIIAFFKGLFGTLPKVEVKP